MTIVRRIARPLLSAVFISHGIDRIRHPAARVEAARPLVDKVAPPLGLPNDPELLVRVNGGAMAGAGTMLALGRLPRLSSLVLATTLVPTTYVDHPFWEAQDPEQKRSQRNDFLKNLGLLGGVLLAAVDTAGRPGLAWRTKHAGEHAQRNAVRATRGARVAAKGARREARMAAKQAKREAQLATRQAGRARRRATHRGLRRAGAAVLK